MLRSMTAYGRASVAVPQGELVCEIRSVNHRYLDLSIRLPEALESLENTLREELAKRVRRGKVDVQLKLVEAQTVPAELVIDEKRLHQLAEAAGELNRHLGQSGAIDTVRLLQWPGVVSFSCGESGAVAAEAEEVFDRALADFTATREREGQNAASILELKAMQLSEHAKRIRLLRPDVLDKQQAKWESRLALSSIKPDQSRLEQEMLYMAQRLDIDEELDRLEGHISELKNTLQRTEPVGRRLDFLMQEFNRETNTLGAKSADLNITTGAVDMKVLIEQMREQIQNIE